MENDRVAILAGSASGNLGTAVCTLLDLSPVARHVVRFPDGEMQVELAHSVRGTHLFLIQATSPPVDQHLIELLMLADACRRAGAGRLTGIIPYFGYARQDRRAGRRSLGARVAADAIATAGFDRLVLVDAHTPAIEGFFAVPIEHLTAAPLLARALGAVLPEHSVVVAPDLGAVKLAREYARLLHLPMAIVHKTRLDGEAVEAKAVMGNVAGRAPLVIDDMLSTGATMEAAVGALRGAGAVDPVTLAVTHALLVGQAATLLPALGLARIVATDTVERDGTATLRIATESLAPLIAGAIRHLHRDESLSDARYPA
ncbi:MAG: ribose-phosphate pyrophosphokinase [Acidobacteria bacterium]|nr:ribose-phosphate pyrophosphokinase [Acidobacteriota bacterium]